MLNLLLSLLSGASSQNAGGLTGSTQKSQPRTSNLDATQMAQMQQAAQLMPSNSEAELPTDSGISTDTTSGVESGGGGSGLGLSSITGMLGNLAGQQGSVSQSNIAQMKKQMYQQYLNNLNSTMQSYGIGQNDMSNIYSLLGR